MNLFDGFDDAERKNLFSELNAKKINFDRGEYILRAGDCGAPLGIVLSGSVNVESCDIWGDRTILDNVSAGGIFAETYACLPDTPLMVDVVAAEKTEILFLNAASFSAARDTSPLRLKFLQNLLKLTAQKNLGLSRRIFHTSPKTIRGRLLSYLSSQAAVHGSYAFAIPFDRQQLADYLCADRSALSAELGRMRDEGLLSFRKNRFELKKTPPQ